MTDEEWIFKEDENLLVRGSQRKRLAPKAATLLGYLLRRRGRIVERERILEELWPTGHVMPDVLREYVFDLRKALGDDALAPRHIETLRGRGYRLIGGVSFAKPDQAPTAAPVSPSDPGEALARPDLVGSDYRPVTALAIRFGATRPSTLRAEAEAAHAHAVQRLASVEKIVQRYGGAVFNVSDDGLLCLFGTPTTFDDHARRAVLAALELVEAEAPSGSAGTGQPRRPIAVGVASGAMIVDVSSGSENRIFRATGAIGEAARRLGVAAAPGEIVLSAPTYHALQAEVAVAPRQGGAEGDGGYVLLGLVNASSGVPRGDRADPPTLFGRDHELATVRDCFEKSCTSGLRIVHLIGSAGLGKSRLIDEFEASVAARATVLKARCFPHRAATPYASLRDVVAKLLERNARGRTRDTAQALLAEALDLSGAADPAQATTASTRRAIFRAIDQLVLEEARIGPLVLLFEDVHWMDATSADWIAELAWSHPACRLLVVMSSREQPRASWHADVVASHIVLPPLSTDESAGLLRSVLPSLSGDSALVDRLVRRSGGNPLFLLELAQAVAKKGASLADVGVPETIHAVVLSRVDTLTPQDKSVLQIGSAISGEIPYRLLRRATGLDDETLRDSLTRLLREGFLVRDWDGDDEIVGFRHALIEESVYESLPLAALTRIHERIGLAMEAEFPDTALLSPEVPARHLAEARHAEAAIALLRRAGRRAALRSAHVEASQHFEKALGLLAALPDSASNRSLELDLLLSLAPSLAAARGYGADALGGVYERARALCDGRTADRRLFKVHVGRWNYAWVRGQLQEAMRTAQTLISLGDGDPGTLSRAHAAMGEVRFHTGDLGLALSHLSLAISHFDAATRPPMSLQFPHVASLCYAAWTAWHLGRVGESEGYAAAASELASQIAHPFAQAICFALLAELHQFRLDAQACFRDAERAIAISREHRFPFWEGTAEVMRGWAIATGGDFEGGREAMEVGIRRFEATGARIQRPTWLAMLAGVHADAGRFGDALRLAERALGHAKETGEAHYLSEITRVKAAALAGLGGARAGRAAARAYLDALEVARRQGAVMYALSAATGLAELHVELGLADEAREMLDTELASCASAARAPAYETARTLRARL